MKLLPTQFLIKNKLIENLKKDYNCILIGNVGSGKTTIIKSISEELKNQYEVFDILNDYNFQTDIFNYIKSILTDKIKNNFNQNYEEKYKFDFLEEIKIQIEMIKNISKKKLVFIFNSFYDIIPEQNDKIIELLINFFNMVAFSSDLLILMTIEKNSFNDLIHRFDKFKYKINFWKIFEIENLNLEDFEMLLNNFNEFYQANLELKTFENLLNELNTPLKFQIQFLKKIM
ncbi:MAG: AAA family ATPase [Candidatus Helarchaeota archaeon]